MGRIYTKEFKYEVLERVKQVGVMETSRQMDVPETTISNWLHRDKRRQALLDTPVDTQGAAEGSAQAELVRLRRENERLKADNALLKKWAAYFAKESS